MMYPTQSSMNAPRPMMDIPPINDDENDDDIDGDEDNEDEDDEKDILLGITPGGPNGVTPGGPMEDENDESDAWNDWKPQTEQEKDLQFEIAAALMDKKGIEMGEAMKTALDLMIEMK